MTWGWLARMLVGFSLKPWSPTYNPKQHMPTLSRLTPGRAATSRTASASFQELANSGCSNAKKLP
eukprot:7092384-Pyramimonas_sp.AAC.1